MSKPDIHADDYALTLNTSKDMLACMQAGRLDSISIVPNMSCFVWTLWRCWGLSFHKIVKAVIH